MEDHLDILKELNDNSQLSDYYRIFHKLHKAKLSDLFSEERKIRIALLSSHTSEPLEYYLFIKCLQQGFLPVFFRAPYNQFNQEIRDPTSKLYAFDPEFTFIFTEATAYTNILDHDFYLVSEKFREDALHNVITAVSLLFTSFKAQAKSTLIFANFIVPDYSPYGIIDNKQRLGCREFTHRLNLELAKSVRTDNQVFILDMESLASTVGKSHVWDKKLKYMSDIPFSSKFIDKITDDCVCFVKASKGLTKKCIVLDLDNTLWGGVIGEEDGPMGIRLGRDFPGNCFRDFQRYLLELHNRGIILAINSKNNPEDALKVIEQHPEMVLRKEHFASIKINWNDKISNLKEIAKELNLGLDSMVFIDDNPVECLSVQDNLPHVKVICLPQDSTKYCDIFRDMREFDSLFVTKDDILRNISYSQNLARAQMIKTSQSSDEYLKGLGMKLYIQNADEFNLQRITQLFNKTNQFNCTTKRYAILEVQEMLNNKDCILRCFQLIDNFGDNGIISVVLLKVDKNKKKMEIDSFLMSCRVLGRNVETAILNYLYSIGRDIGLTDIEGKIVFTPKNEPVRLLYSNHGFKLLEENNAYNRWLFDMQNNRFRGIEYIQLIDHTKERALNARF